MPEIKKFPETRVAFVSEVGPYAAAVERGFARLFAWLEAHGIQPAGNSLGIFYDDPAHVSPDSMRCDLCVPVGPDVTGSDPVQTKQIGGWQVATVEYRGEANVRTAYAELYDWLHAQGYHEAHAPVETYLSRLGEELRAELAVPVVKTDRLPDTAQAKRSTRKTTTRGGQAPQSAAVRPARKKSATRAAR